jgi:hypothetical protein
MQYGNEVPLLGFDRLKIVEWLSNLVQLQSSEITQQITSAELPQLLLQMMETYEMNSLLHGTIFKVFNEAIRTNDKDLIDAVSVSISI